MCGNSICQDRRFLARHMPTLEKFFHYRNLDVSTLKELARRWAPSIIPRFLQAGRTHQALADIQESIRELAYYREHFLAPEYAEAVTPGLPGFRRRRGGGRAHRAARRAHARHAFGGVRCARRRPGLLQVRKPADRWCVQISRRHERAAATRSGAHAARGHAFFRQSRQCARAGGARSRHARDRRRSAGFRAIEDRRTSKRPARAWNFASPDCRRARSGSPRFSPPRPASSCIPSTMSESSRGRAPRRSSCWRKFRRSMPSARPSVAED